MHVAVAGGGIFGQVIAYRLAGRGHRVSLVEPVGPGHAGSGSGDRSRLVRALYDRRCFAESGWLGLQGWARLGAELGVKLVEPTGVLYVDRAGDAPAAVGFRGWLEQGLGHLRALGAATEELTPGEAYRRWPGLSVEGVARVVLEPAGGFGRPALACRALARASLATGRVTHVPATARRVLVKGGVATGLALTCAGAEDVETPLAADAVVVAAGFAGVALVAPFAGALGIRRLPHWTSYWDVGFPAGALLGMDRLPAWADLGAELYGFPDDGESGFKVAWHAPRGDVSDPRTAEGLPTREQLEALRLAASERFPGLAHATFRSAYACAYDATEDETFRIGPVPALDRLVFVGGLSGHGFKHAPSLGESVAALVAGETPALDLLPYALP